jgi:hypothetical protein
LRKPTEAHVPDHEAFYARREVLLRKMSQSLGAAAFDDPPAFYEVEFGLNEDTLRQVIRDSRARRSRLARRIDYLDYLSHALASRLSFLPDRKRSRLAEAAERRWQSGYGRPKHKRT